MAYKYGYDEQDLYVEQGTDRVPDDEQFHIVHQGRVIESHATEKRALARLNQLRFSAGLVSSDSSSNQAMQRALSSEMAARHAAEYSSLKADRTRKGGKGR